MKYGHYFLILLCCSFLSLNIGCQTQSVPHLTAQERAAIQPTLFYEVSKPASINAATPLLILLHGYRSNEADMLGMKQHLSKDFLVISARAPIAPDPDHYAWYGLDFSTPQLKPNLKEAAESRRVLAQFIKDVQAKYNIQADKTFLMGFSQGAIMSTSMALLYPELVGGVVPVSGRLPKEVEFLPKKNYPPFLVIHGTNDNRIPIEEAYQVLDKLKELKVEKVDKLIHQKGHTFTPNGIRKMNEWFDKYAFGK